jgi:hypothetical protein
MPFVYALNLLLTTRAVFLLRSGTLTAPRLTLLLLVWLAGLMVFLPSPAVAGLFGCWTVTAVVQFRAERQAGHTPAARLASLLVCAAVLMVAAAPAFGLRFNPAIATNFVRAGNYVVLPSLREPHLIAFAGALLVMGEANLVVRLLLSAARMAPPSGEVSAAEYNVGRYIGMLERLLIYIFLLNAAYTAVGLVVAAKSFARFKEMDDRHFAEYVLVGTLTSALLAVLIAFGVQAAKGP